MLSFYRISGDNNPSPTDDFQVTAILSEWAENTITYNNLPTYYPHLDIDRSDGGKDNSWIDFNVTDTIQEYVKDPGRNYGFMFEVYMEGRYLTVNSSEVSNESLRPKLTINYDNDPVVPINYNLTNLHKDIKFRKTPESFLVYLPYSVPVSVYIFNIAGREVNSFTTDRSRQWYAISKLKSSGTYIVRISTPEGIVVRKVNFTR